MKQVCVFCASSSKVSDIYTNEASELAKSLVGNDYGIVYGGGAVGLMGTIADSALAAGGAVKGIIPRFMVEVEWEHPEVKNMTHVDTMAQRKALLIEQVDAVVALPGGTGTLEELFEVVSLKKLGLFHQPIILVNTQGFFNPLLEMMDKMVEEEFMREAHLQLWQVVEKADEVVQAIQQTPQWDKDAIRFAAV
ncbi:MAG: TIGR00730 family Rossman fold protein [Marinilabiliaceae bacterium]|nr:TIGR00730 family Rossman fold protein [Marinilabiliaceae bacterium]